MASSFASARWPRTLDHMKRLPRALAMVVICVSAVIRAQLGIAAASAPLIGTIEKYDHLVDGCSCTLFDRPDWNVKDGHVVFVSDIGGHNAWMNISGSMEPLWMYFLQEPARSGLKGDRLRRRYWSSITHVTCDFTATSVCDGKSECDGFGVSATISVVHRSQHAQLRAYGVCGC